jgi:hypothetical protein
MSSYDIYGTFSSINVIEHFIEPSDPSVKTDCLTNSIADNIYRSCQAKTNSATMIKYDFYDDKHHNYPNEKDHVKCCACIDTTNGHVYNSACNSNYKGKSRKLYNSSGVGEYKQGETSGFNQAYFQNIANNISAQSINTYTSAGTYISHSFRTLYK